MVLLRYARFYVSCLLAFTGGHMINYSVIIYAQEVIGSDLLSGIGFGLCFGPPLVLGWYAGVLCDRLAPGRLIHAAQALFLIAASMLAVADRSIAEAAERVPWLVIAAFVTGTAWSFASPARMAALGQIAREDLKPASVAMNLLVMLGFGLAPVAIALARSLAGWPGVFGTAAVLMALASLTLLGVRTWRSDRPHQPVMEEIRDGLRAVSSNPLLTQLMVAAIIGYLALGPMQVLLPKLAHVQLGLSEIQRGAFLGALAIALIVGGVLAMIVARRLPNGVMIMAGIALAGTAFALLSAAREVWWAVALLSGVGVFGGLALSLIVGGIQLNAPAAERGRVVSMYTVTSQVVPAASGVAAGALVQAFGVAVAVLICGLALTLAVLINATWMRALRRYHG